MKPSNTDSVKIIYTELSILLAEEISDEHKRDLKQCIDKFMIFLISRSIYNKSLEAIKREHVEEFLSDFHTTGEKGKYYYNNYKRLNILFNVLLKKGYIKSNVLDKLDFDKKQIENSVSEKSFFDKQTIKKIFDYLKTHDETFYLFAQINYYLMIKSAVVRKLQGKNFNEILTALTLHDGESNVVYEIPDALKNILKKVKINEIPANMNIFTKTNDDFSQSTFFKKWARLQLDMVNKKIIDNEEYEVESFANSMVYDIYSRNGDIYEIQRLLKRSTVYKTKEYLKKLFGDRFEKITKKRN
jgi:hypothetical protein